MSRSKAKVRKEHPIYVVLQCADYFSVLHSVTGKQDQTGVTTLSPLNCDDDNIFAFLESTPTNTKSATPNV
jgi:hypothetical protein